MNCHSVKNDAFVPRECPDDSTIPATITKIMSEIVIDMITFVVNIAQEQYKGAERCHDKRPRIGVTTRLEEPHHSASTEGGSSILGLSIDIPKLLPPDTFSSRDRCLPILLHAIAHTHVGQQYQN